MSKTHILYVCQKMSPYLPEDRESLICRNLPQEIQKTNKEIRTFIPRFGCINERRNQLHEVIRLSGMNIVINDCDHQLIIKVASIPSARMQVYFIDNEDYYQRKKTLCDENNEMFKDNDERSIFYARGVIETVTKLQWSPDIVHCHDWFTAIIAMYVKDLYKDEPLFENSKVILSLYGNDFEGNLDSEIRSKVESEGGNPKNLELLDNPSYKNLILFTMQYVDGIIVTSDKVDKDIINYAKENNIDILEAYDEEVNTEEYSTFYDKILQR
ncbi:MAG: glycogen/starch synthase [Bacteroidetes bacterium]|nr:glycogen/starch synthase [Bacteroidota bacterium]